MNLKQSIILPLLILIFVFMARLPVIAGDKPEISNQTSQYIDRAISINLQWQSLNPVTRVLVYAGSGLKEVKIDEYDNRRNPYGYEGEVTVIVPVDPNLYQGAVPYQIQLEDDLSLKSDLFSGIVKLPVASAPGMSPGIPGMMPGMPGMMPGMGGAQPTQSGDDDWGKSNIRAGKGTGQTADGKSNDMVDKLLKVAERFDMPPTLDVIKVNVLGPDNVSFSSKANDDKGIKEIAFRVYDTQGNKIGEQVISGLGKTWQGSCQPIKTGGGSFTVVAQAIDSTGNTSKEQQASFSMSGVPIQQQPVQPPTTTSTQPAVDQPPAVPAVEQYPVVNPPIIGSPLYMPSVTDPVIFSNGNIAAVQNGPTKSTVFTIDFAYRITFIYTYHYFNNNTLPGTIALKHSDGTVYGPWPAQGALGQGGVLNAYWFVLPNIEIKPGSYTVIDSNQSTWSHNYESSGAGFAEIKGIKL